MTDGIGMLKGRTAIVTGSTSGIGLGIARALGSTGASLMPRMLLQKGFKARTHAGGMLARTHASNFWTS